MRSASPGLAGFLFIGFGATCTVRGPSSTARSSHGKTGAGKEGGDTNPLESHFQFFEVHDSPPV